MIDFLHSLLIALFLTSPLAITLYLAEKAYYYEPDYESWFK